MPVIIERILHPTITSQPAEGGSGVLECERLECNRGEAWAYRILQDGRSERMRLTRREAYSFLLHTLSEEYGNVMLYLALSYMLAGEKSDDPDISHIAEVILSLRDAIR